MPTFAGLKIKSKVYSSIWAYVKMYVNVSFFFLFKQKWKNIQKPLEEAITAYAPKPVHHITLHPLDTDSPTQDQLVDVAALHKVLLSHIST